MLLDGQLTVHAGFLEGQSSSGMLTRISRFGARPIPDGMEKEGKTFRERSVIWSENKCCQVLVFMRNKADPVSLNK